jgi:hypothetical protein
MEIFAREVAKTKRAWAARETWRPEMRSVRVRSQTWRFQP